MANERSDNEMFETLRRRILPSLHDASNKHETEISYPKDLISPEKIDGVLNFFERIDELDKSKLLEPFQTINSINKVHLQDARNVEVAKVVEAFVENVLSKVGELDPRFKSSLIHCGSFYDDVKIGKPDEFDFTAKIESLCVPGGLEARFSHSRKGFVYVVVTDAEKMEMFKDFIVDAEADEALFENEKILSVKKIQSHFSELVDIALKSVNVPENLLPSDEEFSWYSISHGPCATVYGSFVSKSFGEMTIDIDIAPTFDIPDSKYYPPLLHEEPHGSEKGGFRMLLDKVYKEASIRLVPFSFDKTSRHADGKTWTYEYSNKWRVSFNALEKAIFSSFSSDSVEKQLYRVLKAIKDTFLQDSEEVVKKAGTWSMKYEEPPSTKLSSVTATPLFGGQPGLSIEPLSGFSNFHREDFESGFSVKAVGEHISEEKEHLSEDSASLESEANDIREGMTVLGDNPKISPKNSNTEILYDRVSSIPNPNPKPKANNLMKEDNIKMTISEENLSKVECTPKLYKCTLPNPSTSPMHQEKGINTNQILTEKISLVEKGEDLKPSTSLSTKSTKVDSPFKTTTEYRNSEPLIKTYHIKMILFSMKLAFDDTEKWEINNLPSLVLVIKALYYIYSSKQRAFNNFWFQDMIENSEKPSLSLEILQALSIFVEELGHVSRPFIDED